MEKLDERGSYALFPKGFLRCCRPNIHAKKMCEKRKPLTNQQIMPSQYYTSYVPFISSVQKEDLTPVSNNHQQKVGGRKLLPTSPILICISETIKNTSMPYVLALICFMLFNLSDAWAQSAESRTAERQTEIKPLQIGDTIPEEFGEIALNMLISSQKSASTSIKDYIDKDLIVLDFWSTWCGSCISSMRKAEDIVDKYKGQISILAVTNQKQDIVTKFALRNDVVRNTTLPIIVNDEVLQKYFPHISLPHVVFIRKGKVVHIGGGEAISDDIFQSLLNDEQKQFDFYKDDFAIQKPMIDTDEVNADGEKFYSVLTGYRRDSSPEKGVLVDSTAGVKRVYLYNQSILSLLMHTLSIESFPTNRIVFENTDLTLSQLAYHKGMTNKINWMVENAKCYEANFPIQTADTIINEDLSSRLKNALWIDFGIANREVEVLRMETTGNSVLEEDQEKLSLFYLLDAYNRLPSGIPLLDVHDIAHNLYFKKQNIANWNSEQILQAIRDAGVRVIRTKAILPVLVVKGRDNEQI